MVGPDRPQFVLFGSSIVQMSLVSGGWGSILGDLYDRKADIILRGYYGWNSRNALEVLNKIFPQSLGEKLRIIFLTTPPVHEGRILQYYGNKFDKQERTNEACRAYSEALVELCKQMDIKVIDLWKGFQHRHDWGAAYLSDGIHLSEGGSKFLAKEILKVLREAEWKPSLYWLSMASEFSDDSPYYTVAPDGKTTDNLSYFMPPWKIEWMEQSEVEAMIASKTPVTK